MKHLQLFRKDHGMRDDERLCRLQTCLCILTQKQLEAQPRYVHNFWVHMHLGGTPL